MDMFFGLIGFVGMLIFGIIGIVGAVKKSDKAKKNFIISGVCFVLFVIGLSLPSSDNTVETATEPTEQVEEETEDPKEEVVEEPTQEEIDTQEQEKKEAEEKAKKEAEEQAKLEAEQKAKEQAEAKKKAEEVKQFGIGEVATVVDVGFTVQKVEEKTVIKSGNQFIEDATTDGKFVILDIKIDNGQKEALTINSSFFKIKFDGAEYEANTDGKVIMAMGDSMGDFFLEQINPGLSKSGKVVFEVPANFDLTKSTLQCQTGFWGTETIEINLK